jgi:DNA processing protein
MTTPPDELHAALALASLPGVGAVSARRLRLAADSFASAFATAAAGVDGGVAEEARRLAREVAAQGEARGVRAIPFGTEGYPESLAALEDPPVVLFALGKLTLSLRASVALVGARQATPYGRRVVREIARRLASHGIVVVSGLASGIDAEAHAATLESHGDTIAVLGTGVDVSYPAANDRLQRQVARDGLLLSELPPGRRAHAGAFPRRNRIIAALADVVVVVEAGVRSGALITAQVGDAVGRLVAAVPGPIDAEQSGGTNRLLRDGAHAIASVDDVLGLVALTARGRAALSARAREAPADGVQLADAGASGGAAAASPAQVWAPAAPPSLDGLSPRERVLAVLAHGARTPDELVRACDVSPRDVGVALAMLTMDGAIAIDAAGLAYRVDRAGWTTR